jgi:hypothetical protein
LATKKTSNTKPAATSKAATKTPAKTDTKKPKKLPGKSNIMEPEVHKPSIYLDDNQIPKELKGAKVGDTVKLEVTGKKGLSARHTEQQTNC